MMNMVMINLKKMMDRSIPHIFIHSLNKDTVVLLGRIHNLMKIHWKYLTPIKLFNLSIVFLNRIKKMIWTLMSFDQYKNSLKQL